MVKPKVRKGKSVPSNPDRPGSFRVRRLGERERRFRIKSGCEGVSKTRFDWKYHWEGCDASIKQEQQLPSQSCRCGERSTMVTYRVGRKSTRTARPFCQRGPRAMEMVLFESQGPHMERACRDKDEGDWLPCLPTRNPSDRSRFLSNKLEVPVVVHCHASLVGGHDGCEHGRLRRLPRPSHDHRLWPCSSAPAYRPAYRDLRLRVGSFPVAPTTWATNRRPCRPQVGRPIQRL